MEASAQTKFASEARLRSVFLFGNIEPACMRLSGHFKEIEGRVRRNTNSRMKFASEAKLSQLLPLAIQRQLVSMPLSGLLWTLKAGS